MKSVAAIFAVGVLALVVQGALARTIPPPFCPDLAWLVVVGIGLRWPHFVSGVVLAVVLGYGMDLLSGSLMGQHALLRLVSFLAAALAARQLDLSGGVPVGIFVLVISVVYGVAVITSLSFLVDANRPGFDVVGALLAHAIVNATGIQSDAIRQLADPTASPRMLTSRGSHLVIAEDLCPEGVGLLVPSTADGRVLFMLPFFGRTLVGTTDEACSLDEATAPSEAEEQYLLRYIRDWFPAVENPTVTSRWAGGRPLLKPADTDRDSSRVVREHDVETLPCGLVSVMGGKWTTCRPMAIDTLRAVEQQLNRPLAQPSAMPLLGSASTPEQTRAGLLEQQVKLQDVLPDTPLRDAQVMHLQSSFGLRALSVIADQSNAELEPLSGVIPLCRAEIRHVIDKEHVFSTTDVLARRCRLAMVDQNDAETLRPTVESLLIEAGISHATASRDLDLSMND